MKIVELSDIKNIPVSFTLGSFDGLHKGHFVLLSELKQSSVRTNSKSLVISFYPHPRRIVDSDYNLELLNDKSEKLRILNEIGIDYIHFIDFTKEFSKISYKDFYENYIFINLDVKEIIVGSNHGFGMNRDGNKDILSEMCKNHSVKFISVEPLVYKDRSISSTRIRKSLSEGNIEDANEMLGYEYDLGGTVEKGKGLGRKINFPTANIILNRTDKVIPNTGVYFSAIRIKEDLFFGITN
ncbi:MAG: hypothetical protein KKD38_02470, partial [Candidatus Delongbacteria bacterium]|nr:hypothetical protein [Candidatus Delongbacteria bacterium]